MKWHNIINLLLILDGLVGLCALVDFAHEFPIRLPLSLGWGFSLGVPVILHGHVEVLDIFGGLEHTLLNSLKMLVEFVLYEFGVDFALFDSFIELLFTIFRVTLNLVRQFSLELVDTAIFWLGEGSHAIS